MATPTTSAASPAWSRGLAGRSCPCSSARTAGWSGRSSSRATRSVLPPTVNDVGREGAEVIEEKGPTLLVDGTLLISGQIERVHGLREGLSHPLPPPRPRLGARLHGLERSCVIVNVRGEGLVVISACSHSGVINTLLNACRLCCEERILAFIGGWHLSPASMWPVLDRTIAEFTKLGVRYTVPGHCTGWRANAELSRLLSDGFIQSSVVTSVCFRAQPEASSSPPPTGFQ
jgi:7,8-dihydropterin-6-yl-methyl-4-(beta-D-ribofuranosyl)aminobenzene 5'-phosphate synthase